VERKMSELLDSHEAKVKVQHAQAAQHDAEARALQEQVQQATIEAGVRDEAKQQQQAEEEEKKNDADINENDTWAVADLYPGISRNQWVRYVLSHQAAHRPLLQQHQQQQQQASEETQMADNDEEDGAAPAAAAAAAATTKAPPSRSKSTRRARSGGKGAE
jgi:hypothetical protein